MHRLISAAALCVALAVGAAAQTAPSISAENAWARATTPFAQAAAIYVTVTDHGTPDRLVSVSTPVAGKAELHETIHEGNVMKMRPAAGLAVAAGATVSLAPGGYHIMLTELKQPLTGGQSFPLSLRFEKAGTIETTVTVRPIGASAGGASAGSASVGGASGGMDMGGSRDMPHMNMPGMNKP